MRGGETERGCRRRWKETGKFARAWNVGVLGVERAMESDGQEGNGMEIYLIIKVLRMREK